MYDFNSPDRKFMINLDPSITIRYIVQEVATENQVNITQVKLYYKDKVFEEADMTKTLREF